MNMNSSLNDVSPDLAGLFQALGQPARLQLIAALAGGEACVCHLEVLSGQRQAYISQQLGVLRRAGLVSQRREGKHIYYALASPRVIQIIRETASMTGLKIPTFPNALDLPVPGCTCPACQLLDEVGGAAPLSVKQKMKQGELA